MRTSVRFWRWRGNPLKRGTDRVEAWAALLVGLVIAVGAPAAGVAAGLGVSASGDRPPHGWHTASAVLVRKAPPPEFATDLGVGPQVRSAVRWTTADGRRHTGQALVRPDSPAGSRTTIWLDGEGALRDDPVDHARVRARSVACGTLAAAGTALVAVGGWTLTTMCLNRRRAAALDREWERVGPGWGTAAHG